MAENNLIGGINPIGGAQYPSFQPMPQPGGLGQVNDLLNVARSAQGLQQQQFELGQKRTMFVADRLGSLITKPDLSYSDASNMVGDMVRNGIIPASEAPQILTNFPQDPAALKAAIKQSYLSVQDHANRMGMGFGVQTPVNTGGGTQFGVTDPMAPGRPQFTGGIYVPDTPSQVKTVPGPVTRGPGGAPQQSVLPEDIATGIARGTIGYTTGPNGQIILKPAAKGGTTVGMPTAPVGAAEAASVTAKGSAEIGTAIEGSLKGAATRTGMLNNLEDDLNKFDSGPLAGHSLAIKRMYNDAINRTGVPLPQWNPQSVAAQENFNKQATQLAQQQFSTLGGTGTDQQLGSSFKSNPNDALSPMGNKQIISLLKGNEDAITTMNDEWQKWKEKRGSESGSQFMTWFNKNYSPRAFQFARMNKADREEVLKNMQPNERAALGDALKNAEDRGWIKPD